MNSELKKKIQREKFIQNHENIEQRNIENSSKFTKMNQFNTSTNAYTENRFNTIFTS